MSKKDSIEDITESLKLLGAEANIPTGSRDDDDNPTHGGSQSEYKKRPERYRSISTLSVLNTASQKADFDEVSRVINFEIPESEAGAISDKKDSDFKYIMTKAIPRVFDVVGIPFPEDPEILGKGGFGKVFLVKFRTERQGQEAALKEIGEDSKSYFKSEILIMTYFKNLRHVVKLFDHAIINNNLYILMERCIASLANLIKFKGDGTRDLLTEEAARPIFIQMFSAIFKMHVMGVAHCDIKMQNILYVIKDDRVSIRVTDMGNAQIAFSKERGVLGIYPFSSDVYDLGLVLFQLTHGTRVPFRSASFPETMSDGLKEMLNKLIQPDYQRPSLDILFTDSWITSGKTVPSIPSLDKALDMWRDDDRRNKIKNVLRVVDEAVDVLLETAPDEVAESRAGSQYRSEPQPIEPI